MLIKDSIDKLFIFAEKEFPKLSILIKFNLTTFSTFDTLNSHVLFYSNVFVIFFRTIVTKKKKRRQKKNIRKKEKEKRRRKIVRKICR